MVMRGVKNLKQYLKKGWTRVWHMRPIIGLFITVLLSLVVIFMIIPGLYLVGTGLRRSPIQLQLTPRMKATKVQSPMHQIDRISESG